jgi:hypothetical protein
VVFVEQGSDLFLLVRGEFQILGQMIELLIDRPGAVNPLACLIRALRLWCIFLNHGHAGHPECEQAN